jgi:hypothetical protein
MFVVKYRDLSNVENEMFFTANEEKTAMAVAKEMSTVPGVKVKLLKYSTGRVRGPKGDGKWNGATLITLPVKKTKVPKVTVKSLNKKLTQVESLV